MGSINLYKIDAEKQQDFIIEVGHKLNRKNTVSITKKQDNGDVSFGLTLYKSSDEHQDSILSWNWVLNAFNIDPESAISNPRAIILIEKGDECYAVTFGYSFFLADKYCDRNFGFEFIRRTPLKEIKTTTLTTPNAKRNKTVNTYINYSELDFDSGESFAKIKAKLDLPENFALFKDSLEAGTSIKFCINNDSLNTIVDTILYVDNVIANMEELYKIPVFTRVSDSKLKELLNLRLKEQALSDPQQFNISELEIIGATEIFNRNDSNFRIKYKQNEKMIDGLSNDTLNSFCATYNLNLDDVIFDIRIETLRDGQAVKCDAVIDLIDYTDDEFRCLLSKGIWYRYNDDYIQYLKDSIGEIESVYLPQYDFSKSEHADFIEKKFSEAKENMEYAGISDGAIKSSLKDKYYAERWYNTTRETDGYVNYDRTITRVDGKPIELMDLYKDETMYAVKIGNSSAKLCYVIDQSLTSLKMYKHKKLGNMPSVKNVALWLILDRTAIQNNANGSPNIDALDMLMLKNRLDQWKKEVRLQGMKPIIYINYVVA